MFCSRQMNTKINRIHERALRIIHKDYTSSFTELLIKDNSLTIHHKNIHRVAIEMFKVKNGLCPSFLSELFQLNINGPHTRQRNTFMRPKVSTVYKGDGSLQNFGPIVWNNLLPQALKECNTLAEFKIALKYWIPENCPCRLCKNYVQGLGFV